MTKRLTLLSDRQIDQRIEKMVTTKKELLYYQKAQDKAKGEITLLSATNRAFRQYPLGRPKTHYADPNYTTFRTFPPGSARDYPDPLGLKSRNRVNVNHDEAQSALSSMLTRFSAHRRFLSLKPTVNDLHSVVKNVDGKSMAVAKQERVLRKSYEEKEQAFKRIPDYLDFDVQKIMKEVDLEQEKRRKSFMQESESETNESTRSLPRFMM